MRAADMTGSLPLSAPATPSSTGLRRRRLHAISRDSSCDARAATYDASTDDARDNRKRRRSADIATGFTSTTITRGRQLLRESSVSARDASMVLIGTKGSGLSTFAVIAATALRFRLIDTATWLAEHYKLDRSDYIKERGLDAYRKISSQALEEILRQHGTRCVLVCGPEALELHSQTFVRAFSQTHPVIMIDRDLPLIRKHLGLADTDQVLQILGQSQRLCRQISNLEFFNLPESEAPIPLSADLAQKLRGRRQTLNSLSLLQNAKQDFLHFLARIGKMPGPQSSLLYPSAPAYREYSTSLTLRLEDIASGDLNLIDLDCGTDTIEVVVRCQSREITVHDWDCVSRSLQLVRRQSKAPIVYHVECDGVTLPSVMDEYAALLSHGLRLVPDYITIDLGCSDRRIRDLINSVNRTEVIGHRLYSKAGSSFWKDPALHKEFDRAVALGCHVVRFIREAESAAEDRNCVSFQTAVASRSKTPLIAYTTGIQSKSSMVLNPSLTAVRLADSPDSASIRSLLTLGQLMKARFSSFIYHPLHFHIFGASVDYSLSPIMHNAAFKDMGMDHTYSIKQSSSLRDLTPLIDDNFGGASISLPYKSEVFSLLDSVSEAARAIKAVNTIVPVRIPSDVGPQDVLTLSWSSRNKAGPVSGLHGENTDWTALYTCVSRYLSPANAIRSSSSALVIGAGGMARASVYALLRMGMKNIVIWNRTHSKAVQVAEHFTTLVADSHPRSAGQQVPASAIATSDCNIKIVETLDAPWPSGLTQPIVVICTIPAHQIGDTPPPEFVIPQQWFQSRTGGVIVEVSATEHSHVDAWLISFTSFLTNLRGRRYCSKHMTTSTRAGSASSHSKS